MKGSGGLMLMAAKRARWHGKCQLQGHSIGHTRNVQNGHSARRRTEKATQQIPERDLYLTKGDTESHLSSQESQVYMLSITE